MNFRTTLILIAVLAMVACALMFTQRNTPNAATESKTNEGAKLIDLPSATVSRLSIARTGEATIDLVRDGVKWTLTSPVSARADSAIVTQLVDDLLNLQTRGQIGADESRLSATGLDAPRVHVEIATTDGKTVKLEIGQRTASGDNLYVRRDNDIAGVIVPGSILDALDRSASAYRAKQLFDLSPGQVQQISIASRDSTLVLARDPGSSKWRITSPTQLDADGREVSDLLIALTSLSAERFVDEKIDDPKLRRLDSPQLAMSFRTQAPTTLPMTSPTTQTVQHFVKLGAFTDVTKSAVYASTSESSALIAITATSMEALKKSPLDLRDRNLVSIDPKEVQSISISLDQPATTQPATQPALHRDLSIERVQVAATSPASAPTTAPSTAPARKWSVAPKDAAIDDLAIDALLQQLQPLRVERYLSAAPSTQPAQRLILTIKTVAPGGAVTSHAFTLTISTDGGNARGDYNGVAFDASPVLLDSVQQMIQPRDRSRERPPEMER